MDEIVKQALAKWPNVPACWGWLGLDMRGNWWLRDATVQANGPFAHSKGSLVVHEKLLAFIGRNYASNAQGHWFFQNGPQRVYVELESTPMVWRVHADGRVVAHTHVPAQHVEHCLMDEEGRAYLCCDGVLGVVHSQDMLHVADALDAGVWCIEEVMAHDLPARFGFERSPEQAAQSSA